MQLTRRRPRKALSDAAQVDNNGLDAVAFAFNLRLKLLHLVAVEGIGDILRQSSKQLISSQQDDLHVPCGC